MKFLIYTLLAIQLLSSVSAITKDQAEFIAKDYLDNNFIFFSGDINNPFNNVHIEIKDTFLKEDRFYVLAYISALKNGEIKEGDVALAIDSSSGELVDLATKQHGKGRIVKILQWLPFAKIRERLML